MIGYFFITCTYNIFYFIITNVLYIIYALNICFIRGLTALVVISAYGIDTFDMPISFPPISVFSINGP